MTTNFLSLLKSKNLGNNLQSATKALADCNNIPNDNKRIEAQVTALDNLLSIPLPTTEPMIVRCVRVVDRDRLDLFFGSKPSKETRDMLHDQGFRCDIDRSYAWYHKDCLINRMFLAEKFGLSELMIDSFNDDLKPDQVATPYDCDAVSPEFAKYRNQVDQLIEKLKIRPADLMLHAMDCLYIQTFKVN